MSSSSDTTQQAIDNVLEVSFTGFDILNYVDLLQASTDLILSSAIAVVNIFDASMYPSQVPLSITLAPDTIETNNINIQSSMLGSIIMKAYLILQTTSCQSPQHI